jgi:hypothetical protein
MFIAIRRRLEKSSDGTESFSKQVTVSLEDFDQIADQVKKEFDER